MSPAPQMSGVIFSQGSRNVRVRRTTGSYVDGRWVERATDDEMVRAAVRPVSPSDRKLLPEGMRTEDSITLLVRAPLRIEHRSDTGASTADRVLVDGLWWRVVGEKSWSQSGFYRYVAIREPKGGEASP